MNDIKVYLFRIISGAVLSAVFLSLPLKRSLHTTLGLSCGCLMVILTLSPLVKIDIDENISRIPAFFEHSSQAEVQSNDQLLQELICEQTEEIIEKKASELGISAEAEVSVKYDEAVGSYLPYKVNIVVSESGGTLDGLKEFLSRELAIVEERQTWELK